ncbi:MAG: Non-heme chloroperoxidase, partial [Bradyrhizobium sp.]|nr:Non-heme chloroperoxidase [Bradyrhizobium sp.]
TDRDAVVGARSLQAKLVKGAALKVYKGAPPGLCTTLRDQVSEDLFAFCKV